MNNPRAAYVSYFAASFLMNYYTNTTTRETAYTNVQRENETISLRYVQSNANAQFGVTREAKILQFRVTLNGSE